MNASESQTARMPVWFHRNNSVFSTSLPAAGHMFLFFHHSGSHLPDDGHNYSIKVENTSTFSRRSGALKKASTHGLCHAARMPACMPAYRQNSTRKVCFSTFKRSCSGRPQHDHEERCDCGPNAGGGSSSVPVCCHVVPSFVNGHFIT